MNIITGDFQPIVQFFFQLNFIIFINDRVYAVFFFKIMTKSVIVCEQNKTSQVEVLIAKHRLCAFVCDDNVVGRHLQPLRWNLASILN